MGRQCPCLLFSPNSKAAPHQHLFQGMLMPMFEFHFIPCESIDIHKNIMSEQCLCLPPYCRVVTLFIYIFTTII